MANAAVEPNFDLKKRLVGAFVLIGFGVNILPALLGGKVPSFGEEETPVAPRMDSKVFVPKITPIGGATPQRLPAAGATAPVRFDGRYITGDISADYPYNLRKVRSDDARSQDSKVQELNDVNSYSYS